MKYHHGKISMAAVAVLVLAIAAASGWFYYYTQTEKNRYLVEAHQLIQIKLTKEQQELGKLLEQAAEEKLALEERLDEKVNQTLSSQSELQVQLEAEQKSRAELALLLEQSRNEKHLLETRLQEEANQIHSLQAEMQVQLEERQKSQDELTVLLEQSRNEKQLLETRLQEEAEQAISKHAELDKAQADLTALLAQTRQEKSLLESRLQQAINTAQLTTAELETELQKRQKAEQSLLEKISTVSGQKSALQQQLEQEQANKEQIANLKSRLEKELNESRVEISELKDRNTVIKLTSEVLFSSGSAEIKPAGKKVLSIIADSLNADPKRAISIEGHTDNRALRSNSFYGSNWALSAARSLAALDFLQQNNQVDPRRLRLVGYGEFQPISDNETAKGRQQNRRIEIRLLPPVP